MTRFYFRFIRPRPVNLALHPYCKDNFRVILESSEKNTKVIAILRLPCYLVLTNFRVFLTPSVTGLQQKHMKAEPHQQTTEVSRNLSRPTILDKIKWNSKPPSPQIKDEAARRAKTRHFPILDLGGGGSRFSIYFVQDCRSVTVCKLGKTCSDLTLLIEVMIR